ncbi:nucleoporin protein Ndc1-Nup [Necator americanus]|uniref:Nucleoporin protein Ndc1-Nup n=1 Tax=Necator americanus TaxID=51031 RepID=W2SJF5_NECAM|nr:nucleoporin protein Ndc1-Nup [Necator americanus]ETN68877.1 nucleoporin protein Ndc1-Nup [Necator americanus]
MIGDFTPQSLAHNEAASSPLNNSRRSTFDDDAFFSPSKPSKSETRTSRPMLSPQPVSLPTIHDKILDWFRGIISLRLLRTSIFVGLISACVFFFSLIALQFSIRSIFRFFGDAFGTIFAASTWLSALTVGILSFAMSWTVLNTLLKAEQQQRLSWKNSETWLDFCIVLIYNIVYSGIILKMSYFPDADTFLLGSIMLSTIISSFYSIFHNDFQLSFSGSAAQLGIFHSICGMFSIGRESVMTSTFREAARVVSVTVLCGCFVGLFTNGLSSLLFIFYISSHLYCLVIVFGQLFATKILLKMCRQIVMKPISFILPPPFVVHTPTPEQTRTLTNVLDSQDGLLKLFAFTDLRRIAWMDRTRRLEVFSLSQPGGHPRNWACISTTCINVLERIRSDVEMASSRLLVGPHGDLSDMTEEELVEVDREMLMMPQKSRKQLYSSAVRQRHRIAMRPVTRRPDLNGKQQFTLFKKVYLLWSDQPFVIPRFEAHIAVLAIESLYMFVVESYEEDRYGIVLKDLPTIIGVFVQLIQVIDKFFRLRAVRRFCFSYTSPFRFNCAINNFLFNKYVFNVQNQTVVTSSDGTLRQIDAALQAGLLRINWKFGAHLSSLNLSREQLQTIKMVCQSET